MVAVLLKMTPVPERKNITRLMLENIVGVEGVVVELEGGNSPAVPGICAVMFDGCSFDDVVPHYIPSTGIRIISAVVEVIESKRVILYVNSMAGSWGEWATKRLPSLWACPFYRDPPVP